MRMDSFRIFAGIVFAISLFFLFEAWIKEHQPAAPRSTPSASQPTTTVSPSTPPAAVAPQGTAQPPVAQARAERPHGQRVSVTTDTLKAEIDTAGADLRRVELLKYRDTLNPKNNFVLLEESEQHTYVAQSGLTGGEFTNHTSSYHTSKTAYEMGPNEDTLTIRLEADSDAGGAKVKKVFTFHRGSYLIDVAFEITNVQSAAIAPVVYYQLLRDTKPAAGDSRMVPTFLGAEVYTEQEKLHKATFEDIEKNKLEYPKTANNGWIAIVQHYFLAAWLPPPQKEREIFVRAIEGGFIAAGVKLPVGQLAPGQQAGVSTTLYAGPQEQDALRKLAPGLELTVDYGWLRALAVPLFWVLSRIHDFAHNWGVAIILLTVLIKLAFYPLSAASYRSMARMKVLGPKMQKLKERYGDDRQRMHQAMMELYKTEKVNPLGGCLPIVVQIPVFIALYWVLLLSVELRQAPFVLWIHDLSRQDPLYILPVLMGATMFIQTWLNPAPPDPVQAKLMKIMPIAFSIFFFFFPAGLVLYWLVNNILSIAQQWYITRSLEHGKSSRGQT
jgi:YidC/Oxa1 family membrane protein insertase